MKIEDKGVIVYASEFIPDRLYFVTLYSDHMPRSTKNTHYFSIDNDENFSYASYNLDFGPLNLAMLYRFCQKLKAKLESFPLKKKRIVYYTSGNYLKHTNAAYLICSFAILHMGMSPEKAYKQIACENYPPLVGYRDVADGPSMFCLQLIDCLTAISKAKHYRFVDFGDFNVNEYEHYEAVRNGDLNWIVPEKFIAFCGPHNVNHTENRIVYHAPETYFDYFSSHHVSTIVRLNNEMYDASRFTAAGFQHYDLYFPDGTTPSDQIVAMFLEICENAPGAIAVHCRAGLGRTGCLIACYLMKHYALTAAECIAWLRVCRPGSVIGEQQNWLQQQQSAMWAASPRTAPAARVCSCGVYSHRTEHVTASNSRRYPVNKMLSDRVGRLRLSVSGSDKKSVNEQQGNQLYMIKQLADINKEDHKRVGRTRMRSEHIDGTSCDYSGEEWTVRASACTRRSTSASAPRLSSDYRVTRSSSRNASYRNTQPLSNAKPDESIRY